MNRTLLSCCSLILVAYSASVDAQTPQQIAKNVSPSVVLLVMEDAHGQPMSLGSGFFVRDQVVASNLHVVEGASRGYAQVVGQKARFHIAGTVGIDAEHDLVLLRISAPPTPPLSLGNSDAVEVGEPVYAVGNPQGLEGTFSQGIVSSIRRVGSDKLLQITAPISPGSSGGPVLSARGEVIGVAVATFRGGQNLNFAIPSNYLRALADRVSTATPLPQAKSSAERRSILAHFDGRSTEGVVGMNLTYDPSSHVGDYSFSLINRLGGAVRDVYCVVVFYDVNGTPLDAAAVRYTGVIPPRLTKRLTGRVDPSVEGLNAERRSLPPYPPRGKIEFRVLTVTFK